MRGVESRHPPGLIVMLTGDITRYADTMVDMQSLNVPVGTGLTWFKGCLISDGLNKSFARLYEQPGLEWVWVMGDDHRISPDVIPQLLDHDADVVVPLCLHRMPPFYTTVRTTGPDARPRVVSELPTSGLYPLAENEVCGDAGMLIRKRVLDAIPQPWYDTRRSGAFSSDDQAFVERIKEAGFKVHVDCGTVIGHITPMSVTPTVIDGEWKIQIDAADKTVCHLIPRA